ncbi:MAG: modC [Phenylobacterium sp.]|nr:modC [Phenylobacterium sp.]
MTAPAESSEIRFSLTGAFGDFRLAAVTTLPAWGVTAIMGASGAGKTTLLRCLAGLARAEGHVAVGEAVWQGAGAFTPTHLRGVGYVFQEPSLFAHLSVRANLAYGAKRAGDRPGPGLDEVAGMLGLEGLMHRSPAALSGGERQRVAIGRALLARPILLLMDEPLSSLDAASKAELLPYLEQLHRSLRLPVIYVSHDALEVARLADRVVRMAAGRLTAARAAASSDPLAILGEDEIRTLARAALAAGLEVGG